MGGDSRIHEPQLATIVYPQLGFHTVPAGIVRGDNRFSPRLIGVVDIRKVFCSEDGIVYSPGASGFTNPSESAISRWGWVSTTCGAVSTRGTIVFVTGLLGL